MKEKKEIQGFVKTRESHPFPTTETLTENPTKALGLSWTDRKGHLLRWELYKTFQYHKNEQKTDKVHIHMLQKISK